MIIMVNFMEMAVKLHLKLNCKIQFVQSHLYICTYLNYFPGAHSNLVQSFLSECHDDEYHTDYDTKTKACCVNLINTWT